MRVVSGPEDVVVSDAQIARIPYGSIYLHLPDTPRLFVAGYQENALDHWITRDQVVFITQNGRLTRTVGYRDNLLELTNLPQDPLLNARTLRDGASWTRIMRWTEKGNPLSSVVTSRFSRQGQEVLKLAGKSIACQIWQEEVTLEATGDSWENTFWVDTRGVVRQSQQHLGAVLPVEISLLKPATP
ncbi:YjbF family lipoprotein [Enterobacter ludwigii]|uniref:YjbF family lipoprotein n=1 Tax=Enterobacter ludwigii TaxID=299767 RepID=UPI00244ADB4B|nr:YjbF family lipoprotein [Enterobacter ludwigii]WGG65754.1 YjbF family lipoprotein [Enterobacter ludwigii]